MSHKYKDLTPEQYEEHFSNFLINSWSHSKVSTFSRHEAAFEMQYIFGLYSKSGPAAIAGNAYHEAAKYFFAQMKDGIAIDLVDLETASFDYLETVPPNRYKIGKTNPTIEACAETALSISNKLLMNFFGERSVYLDEIAEILDVEVYFDVWLTINGVDIPLPCHGMIDLVFRRKDGKVVVCDHKSKDKYTDDKTARLAIGPQAITYAKAYEEKTGIKVDEVLFIENKHSKNSDGTPQLRPYPVPLDHNTRKLYEALLYDSLRRMIQAVQDPNYVYMINLADNYVDMAEVLDFWCRVQICEIEDFNVLESKKELVAKRLKKSRDASIEMIPPEVIRKFKENAAQFIQYDYTATKMTPQEKIIHKLQHFGVKAEIAHKFEGYSSDTFLIKVSAEVKIGSVYKYRLDIASALDVENVRMSPALVRHEGKSYLAVEIPKERNGVLLYNEDDQSGMRIPLGKDNYGKVVFWDAKNPSTPHVLVCGSSGSGKTELLKNTIRFAKKAGFSQIVVFDTKYTFNSFSDKNVVVLNEVSEIERMADMLVKHMNKNVAQGKTEWILILFDEFADAYDQARSGADLKIYEEVVVGNYANGSPKYQQKCTGEIKSLQDNMRMLLQKGRSSGIRIMQATQRASAKIIDGDAKVNFPVQICLKVPKEVDSKVVLDEPGAESLRGNGDALIKSPEYSDVVRFQSYYKPEEIHA